MSPPAASQLPRDFGGRPPRHGTLRCSFSAIPTRSGCNVTPTLRELNFPAIPIHMGELSFFERVGVLVVEVFPSPELVALQVAVVQATVRCGFVPEKRSFRPHITLARSKNKSAVQARRTFDAVLRKAPTFFRFVASEFRLYESFLGTNGSRYEVRQRFLLNTSLKSTVG